MAKVIGDLCVPTGSYQDRNGDTKKRWTKCGVLLQTDKGFRVKLDTIPVGTHVREGDSGVWFSVFEPREQSSSGSSPAPNAGDKTDNIPF